MRQNKFYSFRIPIWSCFIAITLITGELFAAPPFRFHLVNEPTSLAPWDQRNSSAGYLLSQLTGTLLRYQDHQLSGNLAEFCKQKTPRQIHCRLKKNLQWSNQTSLTPDDFRRAFLELLNPHNHAPRADLLFPIKNAQKIFESKLPPQQLGVQVKGLDLFFDLEQPDSEFIFTLTSPILGPLPASPVPAVSQIQKQANLYLSSGPYLIESWTPLQKIALAPNPFFWKKGTRPSLEILTIPEDSVALSLYEKGELQFLRRLPTAFIPQYKNRADFHAIDQIRFDYIGFSPNSISHPALKKAFSLSLPYADLQKLFSAKKPPGCPGISSHLMNKVHCFSWKLTEAQTLLKTVPLFPQKLILQYSKQGGDDHQRMMEWLQSEWKKNLGLTVEIQGLENKIFVQNLQSQPPPLFRKGIGPDRPTCRSALEIFESQHPENFIQFQNPQFDQLLQKMKISQSQSEKRNLCDQALDLLLGNFNVIPTGPIYFSILVKPEWEGWKLNELNQLDLTDLRLTSSSSSKNPH